MSKIPQLTYYHTLTTLITEGYIDELRNILEQKEIDINESDENNKTFLMLAAQSGHLNIITELLLRGANVHAEDEDNWTSLLYAAKEGHIEIINKLLENGAKIDHRDMGGWTALMWACYKGYTEIAKSLLHRGASANVYDKNHISCLTWASGRGHFEIVRELLSYGAKVNGGDKYGTTPLVWACRKGYLDIADELLRAGANVDTAGMYSWTPLIVATKGGFSDVVEILLEYKPNVNAVDMTGGTALTLACKEGHFGIASSLLSAGAYINLQDRNGDTNLIHATKAGHYSVVDALIKKYADVDIQGVDFKTALYWAVEKNYVDIVRLILNANPNTEIPAKGGDTPLMKATRSRNVEIVQMLIDKKAKVSSVDKKGDTALHIAMRAQSKAIVEIILRNPKNSQLLYRPNKAGETPYNIDNNQHRSILAQIFGARRLNTNEDNENLLGYDLYSSSLADILSEPTLSMPICVGLYAKWGSGKSFLLNKLEDEMHNFTYQRFEPSFEFSWLVAMLLFLASSTVGFIVAFATGMWVIGLSVGSGILLLSSILLAVISFGNKHHDWSWSFNASVYLAEHLISIKTLLQVIFCNPPASRRDAHLDPVRFLFTEQTKVSSSGEDVSVAQIITTLYSAIESEYGFFTTRFYRVFRPKTVSGSRWRYRRLCCIPNIIVALAVLLCIYICCTILLISRIPPKPYHFSNSTLTELPQYNHLMKPTLIALACILGAVILTNIDTWYRMIVILIVSNQRRVKHVTSQSTSYLEKLKNEVELMTLLVQCMDGFISQQTRLVVVVDGLDSCEQEKVLRVLDAVHLLFSDPNLPFVTILALDPHVIIKAIEANINRVFHNSSIRGHDYLRNIVHLPFYLQNSGLRKVQVAQKTALQTAKHGLWLDEKDERGLGAIQPNRRTSASSSSIPDVYRKSRKSLHKLKTSDSIGSSICNIHHNVTGAQDLTKVLLTDDYFSDVNPRSMRRLLNIVYITGRLLKAFNIDFNWYHLAVWINTTERWPYHISWIIMYFELHENELEDSMSLKTIFEKIRMHIPTSKEEEPMLDLDHDERKFDVFLSIHSNTLHVTDLKIFLPFTINLDPYIRKSIHEDQHHLAALIKGGTAVAAEVGGLASAEIVPSSINYGVQGRWGRFSPTRPPSSQPWASPHSFVWRTEARQDSGQGTLSPGPTIWWDYPMDTALYRTRSKQVVLPNDQKLSNLSVDGVINLLSSLENINKNKLADYRNVLAQNNINGQVLMSCDLTELKEVLKMSFGDWELFRVSILSLRDQEYQLLATMDGERSHTSITKDKSKQINNETQEKAKGSVSENSDRTEGRSRRPNAALEKQVTLEENLIFGALETLSEEAQEDALEEKLERRDTLADSFSPVLSVSEGHISDTDSHSTIGSIVVSPAEVDVLYIPRDSPSLRIRATSLPDSVPDVEKNSGEDHIYISSGEISTSHSLPGAGEFRQASSLSAHSPSNYLIKALSHEEDLKRTVLTASMERLAKRKIRFPSIGSNGPPSPMSEKSAKHRIPRIAAGYSKSAFDSDTSDSSSNNSQEKLLIVDKGDEVNKKHVENSHPNETEVFLLDDEHTPLVSPTHSAGPCFQVQGYNEGQRLDSPSSPTTPTSTESRKMHRQFSVDVPTVNSAAQESAISSVQATTTQQSASNVPAPLIYTQPIHNHNPLLSLFGKSSSNNFASVHQPIISSTESVCDILDETIL